MRVLLITGKGGVGKTTVSAATALRAADMGYRTLVMSTDPAHSLGDAFSLPLGDAPTVVVPGLHGQQIDAQRRLETHWGTVRDYLAELFDWGGADGIAAEELVVFPGMDELFALAEVQDHVASSDYDVIVVDCAPTAETLRLLSLPDILGWYMQKLFPLERRGGRGGRPGLFRGVLVAVPGGEGVMVKEAFADLSLLRLRLFEEEMVGIDKLRMVGEELYGDRDPTVRLATSTPFRVFEEDGEVVLALFLPLVDK